MPQPKPKKDVVKAAVGIAVGMVRASAFTTMLPEEIAAFAIAVAEAIYQEDIDGDGIIGEDTEET